MSNSYLDQGLLGGRAVAIVPDNGVDLPSGPAVVYVGGAGDVVCHDLEGNQVTFKGLQAGQTLPVRCSRVRATNTTATFLVALY